MLSIIIPAHNEENYILGTINSVNSQSFKDYELIVVCDSCTDNTSKIANSLVDKVIITKEKLGPARAKNEGAKHANGEKLVFLDADTLLTPDVLKDIDLVLPNVKVGTCRIKPSNNKLKHRIMMSIKNNLLCPFGVSNAVIFCSKDDFVSQKGFNKDLKKGEDGDFIRRLKKEGKFILLEAPVISSTRRFDKKGYLRTMLYWLKEYFNPSDGEYEVVR